MKGKRYTSEQRRALLELLRERKESIKIFAQRQGLSPGTLYRWQSEQETAPGEGFIELRGASKVRCGELESGLRVLISGVEMSFERLPPADWLARLVHHLSQ